MESDPLRPVGVALDQEPESSLQIYREVFDLCDRDASGFITKAELANICQQVSDEEVASSVLDNVMSCLDGNNDGRISFNEFKEGFQAFRRLQPEDSLSLPATPSSSTPVKASIMASTEEVYESEPIPDADEEVWREVADRIDPQGTLLGTGVEAVWKELNQRDPALLQNFEGFLSQVISELKQSDLEKSTLQNHVRRVVEQHNREVDEMDTLLQEELKLARANQQLKNASHTSKLSSHYSSLLAEREAVIEELATQETDLKQALQQKALKESELKREKNKLLTVNRELKEQLDTTLRSDSSSVSGTDRSDHEERSGEEEGEEELGGTPEVQEEEEEDASGHEDPEFPPPQQLMTTPEASLFKNLLEGAVPQEKEGGAPRYQARYFPPKKNHQDEASDSGMGVRQPQAGSNTRGTMARPPDMEPSSPEGVRNPPSRTTPQATTYSHQGGSDWAADPSTRAGSSKASTGDIELSMSGVMPRRDDLPAPSTNPGLSRVFKVIFLGDSGVGKSSLIAFLSAGKPASSVASTVGLDFSVKTLRIGEERVVFQLWDTAGQERFNNALTPVYFRRADAFVIVYDVTNTNSFKSTKKWISVIKAALRELPPVIMLVGNKSDRRGERCVAKEDGRRLALELQALFSETSALSGDNVLQAHSTLAQLLLARENADLQELKKRANTSESGRKKCSC